MVSYRREGRGGQVTFKVPLVLAGEGFRGGEARENPPLKGEQFGGGHVVVEAAAPQQPERPVGRYSVQTASRTDSVRVRTFYRSKRRR